jgi:diacylglycerol kinase family enzyme
MVMEVAGALSGTGVPIGVLRGGTGNLVAGVLGVPRRIGRAVPALLRGRVRRLDLGRFDDGRCFAFAAGLGTDVDMVRDTSAGRKRALGMLAYVVSAARSAWRRREYLVTADVDGVSVTRRVTLAMVANAGALFGGRLHVGPGIRPDDGRLDLCLFSPASFRDVIGITWRVLRGDFSPHRAMRFIQGRRIRLSSDPPTQVQADGDLGGRTPVTIEVLPGAGAFLTGRRDGEREAGERAPRP